jgi:hypothetical protein
MSQHNPLIINPDGSQSPNPNYRGPHPYVKGDDGKLTRTNTSTPTLKTKSLSAVAKSLKWLGRGVGALSVFDGLSKIRKGKHVEGIAEIGLGLVPTKLLLGAGALVLADQRPAGKGSTIQEREASLTPQQKAVREKNNPQASQAQTRNIPAPNNNPNSISQKGTSMGGFADIRGSITPGSPIPAPTNNSGERSHEYEKEWQKSKKSVDGDVSKAEVPSLDKSYGSMSRQEMMDAYDRMRYGDNFDKAREAMGKAKGNPFDSTNNPAKFLVSEEGQKKAVKQGIEMNKHFFAPGGGREREINNPSPPSLSDISTSNKGDGRTAFTTSSQRAKDDAAKAGTLESIKNALKKVKNWGASNDQSAAFNKILDLAKADGRSKFPEVVAAQAMHETGWLSAPNSVYKNTSETNPFGQTGDRGYGTIPRKGFKNGWTKYPDLNTAVRDHITLWHETSNHPGNYNAFENIEDGLRSVATAYSPDEDPENIRLGYTVTNYQKGVKRVLKEMGYI